MTVSHAGKPLRTDAGSTRPAPIRPDWRRLNTGRLFYECFSLYNRALLASLKQSEYAGVRNTHLTLLRHLDADGTRMSDLASRANLTKPAITSLVRACQGLGLVTAEQSAGDARSRVIRFSPRGSDLMRHIQKSLLVIERGLRDRLGGEAYGQLRMALLAVSHLHDEW